MKTLLMWFLVFHIQTSNAQFVVDGVLDEWENTPILSEPGEFPYMKIAEDNDTLYWLFSTRENLGDVIQNIGATKYINNCDYEFGALTPHVDGLSTNASLDLTIDNQVKFQGLGSYKLNYTFSGSNKYGGYEKVYIRKIWYDMDRSDLSFHPLGISLWVKGQTGNTNAITVRLLQQNEEFTLSHSNIRNNFFYTNQSILNNVGWKQLIIPYSWFKDENNSAAKLDLTRVVGIQIDITNTSKSSQQGTIHIDAIQQLTSYKPKLNHIPIFTSIFVQLYPDPNLNTNWQSDFTAYRQVGIDTVIVQFSVDGNRFNYTGSTISWKNSDYFEYDIINKMFTAAEQTGMKLMLGFEQREYPDDKSDVSAYNYISGRNKDILDDLYRLFSNSPALAGWYIPNEFHDGEWSGWLDPADRIVLANYLQDVASHAKTKSKKFPVAIAPALWRGRPVDMTYYFYKSIFEITTDVDILYLQDCGGRCHIDQDDFDVYLPQYFEAVKKACDETGMIFGVDIESFEDCLPENKPYSPRPWVKLKDQLDFTGLFTKAITQFSWTTFRPGVGAFDDYKTYLQNNNLLRQ